MYSILVEHDSLAIKGVPLITLNFLYRLRANVASVFHHDDGSGFEVPGNGQIEVRSRAFGNLDLHEADVVVSVSAEKLGSQSATDAALRLQSCILEGGFPKNISLKVAVSFPEAAAVVRYKTQSARAR